MKLFLLLPCYNECDALPCVLESIYHVMEGRNGEGGYEIVVINDGSEDDTESTAKRWGDRLPLKIINHERNMGLGEAVNTGLSYFCENCTDVDAAVIMDADNTHDPGLIPAMVEKITAGSGVVIASRYEQGGSEIGLSILRRLCSGGANLLLKVFFNIPRVRDYTCGYRAYSGRVIKNAYSLLGDCFIEEKGFTCMAEIIIKLHFMGCEISEVPLVLRYDRKKGRSKMKVGATIIRYFVLIRNIRHCKNLLSNEPALAEGKEK